MNYLSRIILVFLMAALAALSHAADCPDMKKIIIIAKEFTTVFNKDFCVTSVNNKQLEWIRITALPQLMTKSFLSVEPPSNWRELADEILVNCYSQGDLCSPKVQEEFTKCAMTKMPVILFQLSPWISQNCIKVNNSVVKHWPDKRSIVMKLVKEYLDQF